MGQKAGVSVLPSEVDSCRRIDTWAEKAGGDSVQSESGFFTASDFEEPKSKSQSLLSHHKTCIGW